MLEHTTHIAIVHNGVRITGAEVRTPNHIIHINNAEDGKVIDAMFYHGYGVDRYTGNAEGADITIVKIVDGHYGIAIEKNGDIYSDVFRTKKNIREEAFRGIMLVGALCGLVE